MTYEECVYDLLSYYDDDRESFSEDAKKLSDYYFNDTGFRLNFRFNKNNVEVLIDEAEAGHIVLSKGAKEILDKLNKSKDKIMCDFNKIEFPKDHRCCPKVNIGDSDIATLIAVGCGKEKLNVAAIDYGGDGSYTAYLCGKDTKVPEYYKKVFECNHWLKIYDDSGLEFDSDKDGRVFTYYTIYRAGDFGTIIQMM